MRHNAREYDRVIVYNVIYRYLTGFTVYLCGLCGVALNSYVAMYLQPKDLMCDNLSTGIVIWDAPPIIGLRESVASGWNYNLSGHAVAIYAVMSDNGAFAITDPWAGYVGDSANRDIVKLTDDLYDAYNAINGGYMY